MAKTQSGVDQDGATPLYRCPTPTIGTWYKDLQTGTLFEVVARDSATQTIETQYIDGEVAEYDTDIWRQMILTPVAEPEDWRNPFELDQEVFSDPDLPFHPEDCSGPLNQLEPEYMRGVEES